MAVGQEKAIVKCVFSEYLAFEVSWDLCVQYGP